MSDARFSLAASMGKETVCEKCGQRFVEVTDEYLKAIKGFTFEPMTPVMTVKMQLEVMSDLERREVLAWLFNNTPG